MYPREQIDLPHVPADYLETQHLMFQELRHFKRIATPIPEERIRRARAGYYGLITELDEHIGQVWKALEESGELENTIFIYTSDHGEALGDHGLWLKNNLLEPAAHVPLVIAGPGVPRGRRVDHPVSHVDLVQALLEWSGADGASELRGHSLIPLMNGESGAHPGWVYAESHSEGNTTGSFMIRKGPWKYIHFTWYDDLLFNLDEDPGELHDRSRDPAAQGALRELKAILDREVETEAVTRAGFDAQEKVLARLAAENSEADLAKILEGRMGKGLARVLASRAKRQFA
jgi:choline-sulfatase